MKQRFHLSYFTKDILSGHFKHILLVINSATIMADGKEEDFYLVPWIHHRLSIFRGPQGHHWNMEEKYSLAPKVAHRKWGGSKNQFDDDYYYDDNLK